VRCCEGPEAEPWSTTRSTFTECSSHSSLLEVPHGDAGTLGGTGEGLALRRLLRAAARGVSLVTKKTRRRLLLRLPPFGGGVPSAAPRSEPLGVVLRSDLVTFGAANLELLSAEWFLKRCSTDRGWRNPLD